MAANLISVHFALTGLTDEKLKLIGVATVVWNSVEIDLQRLVWTIAKWDDRRGPLVTANLGNIILVQVARNLVKASDLLPRIKDECDVVLSIFDFMRGRRNALIHAVPVYNEDGTIGGQLATFSAKEQTGFITVKSINPTEEFLNSLIGDFSKCAEFIEDTRRKIANQRQFFEDQSLSEKWTQDGFVFQYRAPEIDISVLRTHLAKLHNQLTKQP